MKKTCEICEGSGQVSFFGGVSRFVITWEDCPQCCGAGFVELPEEGEVDETEKEQKENTNNME